MSVQTNITLDDLTNRDLITPRSNQTYELDPEIHRAIEQSDPTPIEDHPVLRDDPEKTELIDVCNDDPEFLKKYVAVAQKTRDLPLETQLSLVFVIDQFIEPQLKFGGAPEAFQPVRGRHLRTAIELHPRSVVYAWRHDCDACDTMKQTLDEVFEDGSDRYGLFAVYGTDCAALLHDQFDVEGAPTTLFCADGVVDSRLMGAQYARSVESEVEMIDRRAER